jgi:hypothetical protein
MQQDIRREAWSAPARRKIAPGQAKIRQAAQHVRSYLKSYTNAASTAGGQQQASPGRGEVLPTPARPADVGRADVIAPRHNTAPAQYTSTAEHRLPKEQQLTLAGQDLKIHKCIRTIQQRMNKHHCYKPQPSMQPGPPYTLPPSSSIREGSMQPC